MNTLEEKLFLSIKAPKDGRVLYATDVHGHFDALESAMEKALFDSKKDILILGGDCIDRGPQSEACMDWIFRDYVYCIRGNHEQMAVDAYRTDDYRLHVQNGGFWFVMADEKVPFADTFSRLPLAIEVEFEDGRRFGIVHAETGTRCWDSLKRALEEKTSCSLPENLLESLLWARKRIKSLDDSIISGIDKVFVGHTVVEKIQVLGNVIYCDTGCCNRGELSLIDLSSVPMHAFSDLYSHAQVFAAGARRYSVD